MLYKYIIEIKNRFSLIFLTWFSLVITAYSYKETLLYLILKPHINNLTSNYFIFTNITEIFSMYLKLIFFIANQPTLFYFYYNILMFFTPGLFYREYIYLRSVFFLGLFIWLVSAVCLTKIVIPFTWSFFLSFQQTLSKQTIYLYFEAKINEFLDFYIISYYFCLSNYLFIFVLSLFIYYININLILIKKFRKSFYFMFFVISTAITPPDLTSQLILSICFTVIFEITVCLNLFRNRFKTLSSVTN